ncbi:hypothetical protein [Kribbella sp. NPDC000426]|uniref:hypothetical protein n=1 Tax=Kribbella sp. NPDC000426 TaxID=3154255 RepID=UPI00333367FE
MGEEFLGVAGVGDDADRVGSAVLDLAGVAEGLQGFGDRGDGGFVADDRAGGGFDVHGFVAVIVAAADEHATLACSLGGLTASLFGVGVGLGGADDLVQPVRRDRVDQRRDPPVDVRRGVLGQLHARRGELAGFPRGGVAGQYAGPGEGEPVAECQGLADEPGRDHG